MSRKRAAFLLVLLPIAGAALMAWSRVHAVQNSVSGDATFLQGEVAKVRGEITVLSRESSRLSKRLARFSQGTLIIVDTARNRLYLLSDSKVVLDAACSTGNGLELDDPVSGRSWIFKTPRGEFRIESKLVNPVWRKPDWAFVEEGKQPPEDPAARLEEGVLGDYALAFGNGYFIHGTLYTRLLGKNVTHGCIRLGDRDLERLYSRVPEGTPIVIF